MNLLLELGKIVVPVIAQVAKKSITTKLEENTSQVAIKSLINPVADALEAAAVSAILSKDSTKSTDNNICIESVNDKTSNTISDTRRRIMNADFRYHFDI